MIAPAASRRIARLKLLTAVLLALSLSAVLALFAFLVARADARIELDRVDRLLHGRVSDALGAVRIADDGTLVVAPVPGTAGGPRTSELGVVEPGLPSADPAYSELYVVQVHEEPADVVSGPRVPQWPALDVAALASESLAGGRPATSTVAAPPDAAGTSEQLRVRVVPVGADTGESRGAVVGVAAATGGHESARRLTTYMWRLGVPLVALSVVVGVLLARGRWWVADMVLERHEQFVAYTAHELRGRLTALSTVAEAGLAGAEPLAHSLERVAAIAGGTHQTIDDLMILSRVETGREPLCAEPVRLDALVATLVEERSDDPPIQLDTRPGVVTVNVELVRRAVDNLIDNAVRHGRATDRTATVTVSVRGGCVEVADTGPGVAPHVLSHLGDRAATNGRHHAGAGVGGGGPDSVGGGLGLTIAAWVARVHNGELRATNGSTGGAVFSLVLPAP